MSEREALAAKIKDAYYHARDNGGTMHTAADDAADAILADGWVHFARQAQIVRAERDALAATVQRVRALCDEVERVGRKPDWSVSTMRLRAALALSDPATDTGGEAR